VRGGREKERGGEGKGKSRGWKEEERGGDR